MTSPASVFATALLSTLVRAGVRDVVVCPGSRSQALALAAAAAERAGAIRLHVRLDERSAAFFALGVARETGVPAPIIVTSGTAVANLAPAVYEAHEGRVPLLILSADRPDELRGVRSNQTTRQADMFAAVARFSLDVPAPVAQMGDASCNADSRVDPEQLAHTALAAARGVQGGAPAGPVHLNLAFREPLSGDSGDLAIWEAAMAAAADPNVAASRGEGVAAVTEHSSGVYTHTDDALAVVIAGAGAGATAEAFARAAGLPLLAEVTSRARFGREAITAYARLLEDPLVGGLTERAIVFGHPTLTRQIPALLRRDDVEVVVVDPHTGDGVDHFDPSRRARVVRAARVAEDYEPAHMRRWLGAWVVADRALREQRTAERAPDPAATRDANYKQLAAVARAEVAALRAPVTRDYLVERVWRATWPHDRLMLAASRLVRVLDGIAEPRRISVHANRGLAGIDGTVATALGIATASQSDDAPASAASVTRLLIGDLALLHDAGSLLLPAAEAHPRLQVFVGNDGGGTIFDTLEAATTAAHADFERVMYTPQHAKLQHLAVAYGWAYERAENRGELDAACMRPVTGPTLVEVPLTREA